MEDKKVVDIIYAGKKSYITYRGAKKFRKWSKVEKYFAGYELKKQSNSDFFDSIDKGEVPEKYQEMAWDVLTDEVYQNSNPLHY